MVGAQPPPAEVDQPPSMDVAITPQSTTKGIFIDFNSTCFHACLTDGHDV